MIAKLSSIVVLLGLAFFSASAQAELTHIKIRIDLDKPANDPRVYNAEARDLRSNTVCKVFYPNKVRAGTEFSQHMLSASLVGSQLNISVDTAGQPKTANNPTLRIACLRTRGTMTPTIASQALQDIMTLQWRQTP